MSTVLIPAHVLQLPHDLQYGLRELRSGEFISLPLRFETGDEEIIVMRISAVDVSEHVVRIEGTLTYKEQRAKLIAQILLRDIPDGPVGYAELTVRS